MLPRTLPQQSYSVILTPLVILSEAKNLSLYPRFFASLRMTAWTCQRITSSDRTTTGVVSAACGHVAFIRILKTGRLRGTMPTSDDNDYRQRLDNFFSVLHPELQSYRETKRYMDRFLSTDFNVFNRIEHKENPLSDIIADLLNPDGSHGQQRIFLNAFLRQINTNGGLLEQPCKVRRESFFFQNESDRGRIDILVTFDSGFRIGIENKLGTGEGDDQLLRYRDALDRVSNGQFRLIYLTPDGGPPDSISPEEENRLLLRSYRSDFLEWLRECVQLCESDKFRWFLRDFMDYIPTMIEGRRQMPGEKDIIIRHALERRENLEMTLGIHFAGDELCKRLIKDFLMKLRNYLDEHLEKPQWKFVDDGLLKEPLRTRSFAFAKTSWNGKYSITIQRYQGCIEYGVAKGKESQERIPDLERILNDAMPHAGKWHSCWEWRRYWEGRYGDWNTKEALLNIKYDGEAVNQLCKDLITIMNAATPIIDNYVSSNP